MTDVQPGIALGAAAEAHPPGPVPRRWVPPGPVEPLTLTLATAPAELLSPVAGPAVLAPVTGWARRGLSELLLTGAALLGLVVMGLTVFAVATGLQPLVVRSGSMEPTVATGGMVLVRAVPPTDIRVGDVVAVERPDRTRVLHRVLDVSHQGATAELVLKGDANEDPDPEPVIVSEASELVYATPVIGRVSTFLASAKGGFVLGSVATAVLMVVLRRPA